MTTTTTIRPATDITIPADLAATVLDRALKAQTWQRIAREIPHADVTPDAAELVAASNGHPSVRRMTQARDLLLTMGNERVTFGPPNPPAPVASLAAAPAGAPAPGPVQAPAAAVEHPRTAAPLRPDLEQLLTAAAGHSSAQIRSKGAKLRQLVDELNASIEAAKEEEAKRQAELREQQAKARRIAELRAELLKLEATPAGKVRHFCEAEGCTYSSLHLKRVTNHQLSHNQEA